MSQPAEQFQPIKPEVVGVMPEQIDFYWEQLAPLLHKPMERMNMYRYYSLEHVKAKLKGKDWQCWAACHEPETIDCAFVTYIESYPTGHKQLTVLMAGGDRLNEWLVNAWTLFKNFAKRNGCSLIHIPGRPGWAREIDRRCGDKNDSVMKTYEWQI